jgi:6-pyruvoyltetrahydropterin/6-carboxytetrahydropterin synthase
MYVCRATVAGEIDSATGIVVNITAIERALRKRIVEPLHGRVLDRDLAAFAEKPATLENLILFLAGSLAGAFPDPVRLVSLHLRQTDSLAGGLSFTGPGGHTMLTLTRVYDFSASHRLNAAALSVEENRELFGKCNRENGHGHNYGLDITLSGDPDPVTGLLVDPVLLDKVVEEEVLQVLDHRNLNLDLPEFADTNPTSENLTCLIWDRIESRLKKEPTARARLHRVGVRETARNYFEYYGPSGAVLERAPV